MSCTWKSGRQSWDYMSAQWVCYSWFCLGGQWEEDIRRGPVDYSLVARYLPSVKMAFKLILFSSLVVSAVASPSLQPRQNIVTSKGQRYDCKCYPGDRCWPTTSKWKSLNDTVNGVLKAVVPDAAVCYNTFNGKPTYNAAACAEVTQNFPGEQWT